MECKPGPSTRPNKITLLFTMGDLNLKMSYYHISLIQNTTPTNVITGGTTCAADTDCVPGYSCNATACTAITCGSGCGAHCTAASSETACSTTCSAVSSRFVLGPDGGNSCQPSNLYFLY